MSKYNDLAELLDRANAELVRLNFKDIEDVLGFDLPASARKHSAWWSNNYSGHVQARSWMDAGWQTEAIDLEGKKVSFRRSKRGSRRSDAVSSRPNPFGCMAGTVTFMPGVDLTEPTEEWDAEREPS